MGPTERNGAAPRRGLLPRDVLSETIGGCAPGDAAKSCTTDGFVWTLLPRHGRRPVRFLGRDMLRADNRAAARAGPLAHWSDIQIYELYNAGFIVAVRHLDREEDRAGWQDAWHAADAAAVIRSLRQHNVVAAWPGAADDGPKAGELQAWQSLIGAIFGDEADA